MRDLVGLAAGAPRKGARTAQRASHLLALLFALSGCGSEEEPKQKDPTIDQFATYVGLYADMVCGVVERCCDDLNQAVYTLGTEESCRDAVELQFGVSEVGTLGSLGAGDATYHEDRQRTCAAALEAASCETLDAGWPPSCEKPWIDGSVPLGGSCHSSAECIDSYCLRPASARREEKELIHLLLGPWPDVPAGTCVEPLGDGADCVEDHECQSFSCEDGVCEETPSSLAAMCPL